MGDGIPQAVVEDVFIGEMSPIKAWRRHFGRSDRSMAVGMGMSLGMYRELEKVSRPGKAMLEKAAKVLGIEFDQIDMLNREGEDAQ